MSDPRSIVDLRGVPSDEWGTSASDENAAVCQRVAECFTAAIQEAPVEPIDIVFREAGPRAYYERKEGRIQIGLSARDRHWSQLAFQFAHEFLHALGPLVPEHAATFVEESLAETASLFALRAMKSPFPHLPHWVRYQPAFRVYAQQRIDQHQLPPTVDFKLWLREHLPALQANPVMRAENAAIACRLLPIFEQQPEAWRTVRYLRSWPLESLFDQWREAVPADLRRHVTAIEAILFETGDAA